MFPEILTVTVTEEGERQILHLDGQLDLSTVGRLDEALAKCHSPELVLDLSRLVFLDSVGIRALVQARQELLAAGRAFQVTGLRGQVRQIVDLAGLRGVLG